MAIARLVDFLEENRDDKIRMQIRLENEISELKAALASAESRASFDQGRYEGAVKAVEALKRDVEFHREQKETYRWWLEDSQKRNADTNTRLMLARAEIAALKDGIDALAYEFTKPLVLPVEWGSLRFVTVFAENPDTGERIPVWLS